MAKLKSNLSRIAQQAPQAARRVRMQTAEDIGNLAQQLAPVDSGELRDSKEVEHQEDVSIVGFTAEHAPFQEFGTSKMAAQPFLTPAFHQIEFTFEARLKEEMEKLK